MLPLAEVKSGAKVKIVSFTGGKNFLHRISSMGISVGDIVEVLVNNFHGPVVIVKQNLKIALGRGMAQKVMVEYINESLASESNL